MQINICLSSDNNYAQHLTVTIASILKNANTDDELFFFIFDGGITSDNKEKILKLKEIKHFEIKFILIDSSKLAYLPNHSFHISIATYFRFKIASLLPINIDKIIYLDCDIIVLKSLSNLFNEDIKDYYIAGVEDIGYYFDRRFLKRETDSFYINAGVLLINIAKWREDYIEEKLLSATENNLLLIHNDQDIINFKLKDKIKALDLKWNVQDSFARILGKLHPLKKQIKQAVLNPAIVHYTGAIKPWQSIYIPFGELYIDYLKLTPFYRSHNMKSKFKMFFEYYYFNLIKRYTNKLLINTKNKK
ncbi:glycosyltransferase family 8 protein [Candidatus Ruminimicrobium bovinum]|uniref:glycosyltransferase family 8 protein n=1 Tax=Candidatus Ruminimicrobium bovinum TaxID=3242779 RepID=UPI0039B9A147